METVTTPFSRKQSVKNHIYVMPTSDKSRAAYILLFNKLRALDDSEDWASELKKWLVFRKEFLQEELKREGKLRCAYCGRDDLVEGHHEFHKKHLNMKIPNLATVDHIHPLSLGGAKYHKPNCTVACRRCNSKKGNKLTYNGIHN
jgi:5-methylcytosine-specific restriction endonuclease McrA